MKAIFMNLWILAIVLYLLISIGTLIPVVYALIRGVKLHEGGDTFNKSPHFSEKAKARLTQHYSRILGTLCFWKQQAEIYRYLHYYTLFWTIPASVIIPFLVQTINEDPYSKWLVTIISSHTAILFAFHKALKIDANFRAWREGESHFYDLYRRMLDQPETFGNTEDIQLSCYFDSVEKLRMFVRNAELDNTPSIEEINSQFSITNKKSDSTDNTE